MAELRPLFRPPDPCQRTFYAPGELVQFDLWQPDTPIPLGFDQADKLWVVTAVSGYSRFMAAWMVPSRAAHDVLGGHAGTASSRSGRSRAPWSGTARAASASGGGASRSLTEDFQRFRGTLGVGCRLCKPNDPEAKGMNERANGYYETSFLPGRQLQRRRRLQRPADDLAEAGEPQGARAPRGGAGRGDL